MSSSLSTLSSTDDEMSSSLSTFSSFSDGNSRKTMIGDGGMKRKMTELFILTVVNITVTVALINFITPNENGRINSELESLKKFVGKIEQQRGNNDGQQTEFCAKMDTEKDIMAKAIETKLNELVEQQKKEAIFIGVLKDQFENEREMPTNEATADQLSKILERISEIEKQQKQQQEEITTKDGQQTEFCAKMDTEKDMVKVIETKLNELVEQQKKDENFIGLLKDRFGNELLKAVHPNIRKNIAEKFSYPKQNCWDANAIHNDLEIFGSESLKVYYKGDGSGRRSVFAKHPILFSESGIFYFEIKIKSCKSLCSIGLATKAMPLDESVGQNSYSCAYQSDGQFLTNWLSNIGNSNFFHDDFVGCGINLATRRVIFTKNGQPLNTSDLFLSPPFDFPLFPFISLSDSGDLIETNFGPKFIFHPAKVQQAFSNFRLNYWDANACHKNLEIIGNKNLVVNYKKNSYDAWRSVFAKYSILLNKDSSDTFYYEILVKNMNFWFISFGFTVKQQEKLVGIIQYEKGIYAYESDGKIWYGNGREKGSNYEYSYGVGDTVGMGINWATRQLFFTKNGLRLEFSDLLVSPSFADDSFHPFVTLSHSDDKIEANFGPNFKFDLETL